MAGLPLNEKINNNYPGLDPLATLLTRLYDLSVELKTDFNLLLAKLDADAGVTGENYASTLTISSTSPSDPDA